MRSELYRFLIRNTTYRTRSKKFLAQSKAFVTFPCAFWESTTRREVQGSRPPPVVTAERRQKLNSSSLLWLFQPLVKKAKHVPLINLLMRLGKLHLLQTPSINPSWVASGPEMSTSITQKVIWNNQFLFSQDFHIIPYKSKYFSPVLHSKIFAFVSFSISAWAWWQQDWEPGGNAAVFINTIANWCVLLCTEIRKNNRDLST